LFVGNVRDLCLWQRHIRKKRNVWNRDVRIDFREQFSEFVFVVFHVIFRVIAWLRNL
jgi:hypothetical protein